MAWTDSRIFREFIQEQQENSVAYDLSGTPDSFLVALFNNSITPDRDAAGVLANYNGAGSAWLAGANNIEDSSGGGTDWPELGRPLVSPAITVVAGGIIMFDAADTASAGATADIALARGCLVYDDTIASDPGISFHHFGADQSVTNGTFTVVWHANGLFRITV
jgi:hypothetical protein